MADGHLHRLGLRARAIATRHRRRIVAANRANSSIQLPSALHARRCRIVRQRADATAPARPRPAIITTVASSNCHRRLSSGFGAGATRSRPRCTSPRRRRRPGAAVRSRPGSSPSASGAPGAHPQQHVQQPAGAHGQRPQPASPSARHRRPGCRRPQGAATAPLRQGTPAGRLRGSRPGTPSRPGQQHAKPMAWAVPSRMRPLGIGRSGRSMASSSRSKTSFSTTPAVYSKAEAAARQARIGRARSVAWTTRYPAATSAKAVNTFGRRHNRK